MSSRTLKFQELSQEALLLPPNVFNYVVIIIIYVIVGAFTPYTKEAYIIFKTFPNYLGRK